MQVECVVCNFNFKAIFSSLALFSLGFCLFSKDYLFVAAFLQVIICVFSFMRSFFLAWFRWNTIFSLYLLIFRENRKNGWRRRRRRQLKDNAMHINTIVYEMDYIQCTMNLHRKFISLKSDMMTSKMRA